MKTYVIGDLQGCFEPAQRLLARIDAQPGPPADILFAGDLINRGPDSLATLRRVRALAHEGARAGLQARDGASGGVQEGARRVDSVLGNHDLHLLAVAEGLRRSGKSDTLAPILAAPDRAELLDWLRHRPLALQVGQHVLVHAGVPPQWSAEQTLALAGEVETVLRGPDWRDFLAEMYGNAPAAWDDSLTGNARLRCIVNALTRLRYCSPDGAMDFKVKEGEDAAGSGLLPWFDMPGRRTEAVTMVFGHWSALGLQLRPNLIGLDSGCVWGGQLSAVCLDDRSLLQERCPEYREHDGKKTVH